MRRPPSVITVAMLLSLLASFTSSANAEQYLCVPEEVTGFRYDNRADAWVNAEFKPYKYMITESTDSQSAFKVSRLGTDFAMAFCSEGFNESGYLLCDGISNFYFNKENSRFLLSYPYGYFNVLGEANGNTDKTSDTPYMGIGLCSPF